MDCEQVLSLSESLLTEDGQTVIEASMQNVGVAQTTVILRQSLRIKLHKKELTKEQVCTAFAKAGLDSSSVDDLLIQK